jgi:hypothetical protein
MFSDQQVEAAVRALSDPERFADAERLVSAAAPQLHRVLAHALNEGGWFGPAHRSEVRSAVAEPDEATRATRIETLLAEETRLGMMVGVAVGWELARELGLGASAGRGPARSHAVSPDEDPTDTGGD